MKRLIALMVIVVIMAVTAAPAVAQELRALPPPAAEHTIRIRLWDSASWPGAKRLAAIHGLQSRELGAELRAAARKDELKPLTGCHQFIVEFRDAAYETARGRTVHVNGKPFRIAEDFGPSRNSFEVEVCNGEGTLTIETGWLHGDTIIFLRSPWRRPQIHYPPSGALRTCTGQEIVDGRCGPKWKNQIGFGELFRLVREHAVSNYHFVK